MKKLKIFALAASLLQAVLFSAFAANPPSDFTYELINNNQAIKITGVRNDKAEYVVPASIEDFPVTEVDIVLIPNARLDANKNLIVTFQSFTISLPEGCVKVSFNSEDFKNFRGDEVRSKSIITVRQLPSTVKELSMKNGCCKYDGTLPIGIEQVDINGTRDDKARLVKLNQSLSKLQNLKSLRLSDVDFVGAPNKTPLKLPKLESLYLGASLGENSVNLIDKSISINSNLISNAGVHNTNVEELIFEEGVQKIPNYYSFPSNDNLKRIVLPSTLESIAAASFRHNKSLSEVVIPDSLTKVEVQTDRYFSAYKVADVFDTTSLSLKCRIKLQELLGFKE